MLARILPPIALLASILSTLALAVVLGRAYGVRWPSAPTHWTMRTATEERVIAAGREQEIFRLVVHGADAELSPAERPAIAGIQVERGTISVAFSAHPHARLTIAAAPGAGDAFLKTDAIALSWSDGSAPDAIQRYAAAIARSPAWKALWTAPARGSGTRPPAGERTSGGLQTAEAEPAPGEVEHPLIKASGAIEARVRERSVWQIIVWSLIAGNLIATALLFTGVRQSRRGSGSVRTPSIRHLTPSSVVRVSAMGPRGKLAVLTGMMAFGVALYAIAHFHFRLDDYAFLALAERYPTEMTGETRILSTRVYYQVGASIGGPWWFTASNLVLLGAMAGCWGLLLHRVSFPRDAAIIAAALLALGPGTFFLLRQANGVEHLSVTTCVMLVLLLTDLAARERERPPVWRYGVLLLALCFSVLGVLMKLPLMVIVPPTCWLWGRWVVPQPMPPMHRSLTYLAYAAVIAGPMFALTRTAPEIGILVSRWALAAIGDRATRYATAVVVLLVVGAVCERSAGPAASAVRAALRTPMGRLPLLAWASALTAIWIVPFVLHAEYEGEAHYGMLVAAPLGAVAALLLAQSATLRGARTVLAAILAAAILLPLNEIRTEGARARGEHVHGWLREVRALTSDRAQPARIVVVPGCALSPPLRQQMNDIYAEIGIWWATGWYDVPVEFHDVRPSSPPATDAVVTLTYCPRPLP